jgi:glucose/arabinose dehydrogenase
VVRLTEDGKVPADNPFVIAPGRDRKSGLMASAIRRMAMNPWSDTLWLNEHGPRGGDEINIPQKGKNYGWPLATHGINYSGLAIPEAQGTAVAGTGSAAFRLEAFSGGKRDGFYAARPSRSGSTSCLSGAEGPVADCSEGGWR